MKRILSILFTICLLAAMLPVQAMPVYANPSDEGTLHVACNMDGADVYIDGELYEPAVTPCDIPVNAGEHDVKVCMAGYIDYAETAAVTAGGTANIAATLRADIPSPGDPGVRVIMVDDRYDSGLNFETGGYCTWENYEKFIINSGNIDYSNLEYGDPGFFERGFLTDYGDRNDGVSLRMALCIVMNDDGWYDEENQIRWHYLIEFLDTTDDYYICAEDIFCLGRGHGGDMRGEIAESTRFEGHANDGCFTINGDRDRDGTADVTLGGKNEYWDSYGHLEILRVSCSDVHINGINFTKSADFTVYKRFNQAMSYFDIKNISLTGCSFEALCNGTGRCFLNFYSQYGHGASGYGQFGAYDLDGFSVSGCTFDGEALAVIMATGDSDYIRTKNITFQGNKIFNGMIFVRNTDANTWYMWGPYSEYGSENSEGTTVGFCDYNTMENVTVSGNRLEFDEEAPYNSNFDGNYGQVFHVGNANSGASHNTTRNVTFRCNTSRIDQTCVDLHEHRPQASISIDNAGIGDRGAEMGFDDDLLNSLCETSHNTMENLRICYNDLELLRFDLKCSSYMYGGAPGTDNTLRDVSIDHNIISSVNGLRLSAVDGESGSDYASGGTFEDLTVSDNVITARRKTGWSADSEINSSGEPEDYGIRIFGSQIASFDMERYGQSANYDSRGIEEPLSNIQAGIITVAIHNNEVNGFSGGIVVAGALCERTHYVTDVHVTDVDISGNAISTDSINKYCNGDGILVAGAIDGGTGCSVDGISIGNNCITAANGVAAAGFYLRGQRCRWCADNNRVNGLSVQDNSFIYSDPSGNGGFPILAVDAMAGWDEIPAALGDSGVSVDAADNIDLGFPWDSWLLSAFGEEAVPTTGLEALKAALKAETDGNMGEDSVNWTGDGSEGNNRYIFIGEGDKDALRAGGRHRFYRCIETEPSDELTLSLSGSELTADYTLVKGKYVFLAAYNSDGKMLAVWNANTGLSSFTVTLPSDTAECRGFIFKDAFVPLLMEVLAAGS